VYAGMNVRFWHKADIVFALTSPLLGEERTWQLIARMSAFDPKRTFVMSVAAPRNALRKQERQALSTPDAFARWVEIASISAGERQSYGSNPNSFSRARTAGISLGGVPDSMIEETNATCENIAPMGFQHLVHPHTWL
jgi:hypothetical protein